MKSEILKTLKKFGLTDNEAIVYVECLKDDVLSPFQISKLTQIPRTTVYDILMSLSLKGLVEMEQSDGFQKQQTKVKAKNPSVMRKIIQKRREESYKTELDILNILPELKKDFHKDDANALFHFYPGIEGVKEIYKDIEDNDVELPEASWSQLLASDVWEDEDQNRVIQKGNLEKKEKHFRTRELVPLNAWSKHVISYQFALDPTYLESREFRFIDNPIFECFLEIIIKGDYIKIACSEGDEIWGLKMKSPALSKTLLSIYNIMWQMGTPITKKLVKSWGENEIRKAELER